jgi:signal transduction histidine kinase
MIEISIEDNGVGIPRDQLEKVFDPVFTTKPQGEGTGLGLYICQQIVSDHRGEIQITSKPGEGTTVTVLFPYDVA